MVKVSKERQPSKNISKVLRTTKRQLSPIEELTFPVQMERQEPWIKQIYSQAKLTSGTFSKPLKTDSQYNDKEEHQPISDWSARVNQDYYDNLIDTSLDWGKFNQPGYGSDQVRPVWYTTWPRPKNYNPSSGIPAVAPPGTFLNFPMVPRPPKPGPSEHKPKPDTWKPPTDKDWYKLKWNKIKQGTFQGEAVSYLSFWIGDKNQIRKGYEDDIFISFANPYVGLSSGYGKGILIDGLIFNTDTFNEITARLFDPKDFLERIDLMIGQRIKFIGDLGDEVILHDTTHGDHEPTLAFKHIPLKDAGVERSKKETNRVYWLVRDFKVFQVEGTTGAKFFTEKDTRISGHERRFIDLAFWMLNLTISDAEFLAMPTVEKQAIYERIKAEDI